MLKVNVEGVYESVLGTGQVKYVNFEYTFETSRINPNGIYTHIARRFIPMLIEKDKKLKSPFSALRSFNIISIDKIADNNKCILGKNIDELDEWQIQDLACTFDLYDVPLYGKLPFNLIKDKAISSYFKKVLKFNVDDSKEKAKLDCVVKNADGTLRYDFTNSKVVVQMPQNYLAEKNKSEQKVKVSDLIEQAGQAYIGSVPDEVQNKPNTANEPQTPETGTGSKNQGSLFPSKNDLIS
ncbi:MAG: hypothetical protein SPL73_05710 [Cyanobacteriota bacterium]|nr:hypothetical protein [Cyanobacteriota bacterium]MDY6364368.1 hypothetical protein [Cyanobacteriota bacterium]